MTVLVLACQGFLLGYTTTWRGKLFAFGSRLVLSFYDVLHNGALSVPYFGIVRRSC